MESTPPSVVNLELHQITVEEFVAKIIIMMSTYWSLK